MRASESAPSIAGRRLWQVAYDIADPRRLRRVEKLLAAAGERQHLSLFVCDLSPERLAALQARIVRVIDTGRDTVRYMPLCGQDRARTRHLAASQDVARADCWVV